MIELCILVAVVLWWSCRRQAKQVARRSDRAHQQRMEALRRPSEHHR